MSEPNPQQFRLVVTYPIGVKQIGRARDLVSTMAAYAVVRQAEGPRAQVEIVPDSRTLRESEAQTDAKAKQMIAKVLGVPPEKIRKVEVDPLACSCCGESVSAPMVTGSTVGDCCDGAQVTITSVSPETPPPPQRESRMSRRLRRHLMRSPILQHLIVLSALPWVALAAAILLPQLAWRRFRRRRPRRER